MERIKIKASWWKDSQCLDDDFKRMMDKLWKILKENKNDIH
tara:strand:- start:870 stop:992 length:123 start_codon:yes stop_codon:yes gene_type:complete